MFFFFSFFAVGFCPKNLAFGRKLIWLCPIQGGAPLPQPLARTPMGPALVTTCLVDAYVSHKVQLSDGIMTFNLMWFSQNFIGRQVTKTRCLTSWS